MKINQVALITYTIRDAITTADGFRKSMAKLSDIGYKAVQISGMADDVMAPETIAQVCRDNGLTICATHEPSQVILDEPERVVERLQKLGCRYTAYPYPSDIDFTNHASLTSFIAKLEHAGSILSQNGQVLTYHNHANEFYRLPNGNTVLQEIYNHSDPAHLKGEIDTYWVQLGGGSPEQWCRDLEGRLPLLHLKDVGVLEGNEPTMDEIGAGNLDFTKIIRAAEDSGCEWFIVEQDRCPGDPFESAQKSFDYIKQHLVD